MSAQLVPVGTVVKLMRFPVKSMRGEALVHAKLGWHGFHGDRRYALQRIARVQPNGLPWASARQCPELLRWAARVQQNPDNDHGRVIVSDPTGAEYDVSEQAIAEFVSAEFGEPLVMTHLERGTYDAMDVSVITTTSIASIESLVGRPLEIERFRPNIVVRTDAQRAYPEDKWVGQCLVFGAETDPARVRLNRKDPRCRIIDFDPATGEADGDVFGTVVRDRRNLLGAYGSVERCGVIRVGDTVSLRTR